MKYHIGFLGILMAILGIFGYLALTFNEQDLFFFHGSNEDIGQFLNTFRQEHKPVVEINFTALYGGNGQFQVLHPLLGVRKLHIKEAIPSCRVVLRDPVQDAQAHIEPLCRGNESDSESDPFSDKNQTKRDVLERFLNEGTRLPENFITTPPFIDGFGSSYAYLLSQKGTAPFNGRIWVQQHLSFFKVSELKEIINKYNITDVEYSTISRLNESEIEEVVRGSSPVLTRDYLLFKNQPRFGFSPLSYLVYDIQDLRTDLKNGKYEFVTYAPGALCLQKMGNVCWTYSSKHALAYLYRYSLAILILVGLVFFIFLCLYLKHLYEKNREQQKHRLALQVLSHEFRTPVSSMLLIADQLTRNQDRFDLNDQDLITRMSTEAFRLQRIIEISKTYLQAESHRIQFKYVEIPSINNWISDFVTESNLKIKCQLLQDDHGVKADPFWLKFILSNLVQNAFAHGKEPVCIRLENKDNDLKITVEDQGQCEFRSLSQMTDAFVKSSRSKGMGLGLNIAKFIVEEWGSEIGFSNSPTSFTLSLGDANVR